MYNKHTTKLRRSAGSFSVILFLLAFCILNAMGDIIWFNDGAYEEGRVEVLDDKVRVYEREGTGMYEIQSNLVNRIDYNTWKEDLAPGVRKKARVTIMTNVIVAGQDTAITVTTRWDQTAMDTQVQKYTRNLNFSVNNKKGIVTLIGVVIFFILMLTALVCEIIILVDAFKKSLWWGLACLFVPFVFLYYLIFEYTGNKLRMFMLIVSPVIFIVLWWWLITTYVSTGIL